MTLGMNMPAYLDYQATTPLDPRVREVMSAFYEQHGFGNPHSVDHAYGWRAANAVKQARAQVAEFINADDNEIIFTSGATESCNLAVRGVARQSAERNEIITLTTEHPAVLETVRTLRNEGFTARILPVGKNGIVDLSYLAEVVSNKTCLVSAMFANNEIGVVQPIARIARIAHQHGALMHTDATQAAGRIALDVDELGVDLLTLSGHKVYGPQGVGCLYVRNAVFNRIASICSGGSQERGLRSGTIPVALVSGFGSACEIAGNNIACEPRRIDVLTEILWRGLIDKFPGIRLHGCSKHRIPGNLNVAFPELSGAEVIAATRDKLAISSGSACSSAGTSPSHVITALGLSPEEALQSVRISLGRFTTEEEVRFALTTFAKVLNVGVSTDQLLGVAL